PTGGLDVSVPAPLLDLLRGLVVQLKHAVVIFNHYLCVGGLLADPLLVMKQRHLVETWLNDPVLQQHHQTNTHQLVLSELKNLRRHPGKTNP
ncbi:hypothetical protein ACVGWK_00230, partial [Enterobacter sichuanensis]